MKRKFYAKKSNRGFDRWIIWNRETGMAVAVFDGGWSQLHARNRANYLNDEELRTTEKGRAILAARAAAKASR